MSDYTSTFTESTGDSIDTTDFSTEFDAIETASATKLDATAAADRADSIVETGSSAVVNMKIVNIGDWNMDSTNFVQIAHGLTFAKIVDVDVVILIDDDVGDIAYQYFDGNGLTSVTYSTTTVDITRLIGGNFDTTNFDKTSFNRGYITIWYTD